MKSASSFGIVVLSDLLRTALISDDIGRITKIK